LRREEKRREEKRGEEKRKENKTKRKEKKRKGKRRRRGGKGCTRANHICVGAHLPPVRMFTFVPGISLGTNMSPSFVPDVYIGWPPGTNAFFSSGLR
jgi:hypothetical protein